MSSTFPDYEVGGVTDPFLQVRYRYFACMLLQWGATNVHGIGHHSVAFCLC